MSRIEKQEKGEPIQVDDSRLEEIISQNRLVLADFWAPWCAPCRVMEPILESLAKENSDGAVFLKVNVDDNQGKAAELHVHSIPTLVIFKDGEPVDRIVGAVPKAAIEERIQRYS